MKPFHQYHQILGCKWLLLILLLLVSSEITHATPSKRPLNLERGESSSMRLKITEPRVVSSGDESGYSTAPESLNHDDEDQDYDDIDSRTFSWEKNHPRWWKRTSDLLKLDVGGNFMAGPNPARGSSWENTHLGPLPEHLRIVIDPEQDPCENFGSFASGGSTDSSLAMLYFNANKQMRDLILDIFELVPDTDAGGISSNNGNRERNLRNIKYFYGACRRRNDRFHKNLEFVLNIVAELGSCPLMAGSIGWSSTTRDASFQLNSMLLRLVRMGLNDRQPIKIDIIPDPDDRSRLLLQISQPDSKMRFIRDIREAIKHYGLMLSNLGIGIINKKDAIKHMKDALIFGNELNSAYDNVDELDLSSSEDPADEVRRRRDRLGPKKMSLAQLRDLLPDLDVTFLVSNLLGRSVSAQEQLVLVSNESYLRKLNNIIKHQSPSVISNYVIMNLIQELGPIIGGPLGEQSGIHVRCSELIPLELTSLLTLEYKRRHLDRGKAIKLARMVQNIRDQMEVNLRKSVWMSRETKVRALEKLKDLRIFVGVSGTGDYSYDNELAKLQFNQLELTEKDDLISSLVSARRSLMQFKLTQLALPTIDTIWCEMAQTIQMQVDHMNQWNALLIPLGMLDWPLFDSSQPDYMNYGGLGLWVARALIKEFDQRGAYYRIKGANGIVRSTPTKWWDQTTQVAYQKLKEEYVNRADEHATVEGEENCETANNDLVDFGGLRLVYEAYKLGLQNNYILDYGSSLEPRGKRILYQQHLFFVSAATTLAETIDAHYLMSDAQNRVTKSLRNIAHFSELFACPPGSRMNPRDFKRSSMW